MLEKFYFEDKMSMLVIAKTLNCSENKVSYWMDIYGLKRRTISDAVYLKNHPHGDPFKVKPIRSKYDNNLLGLGLGLYWGEGNKANKNAVRLGNTDPALIRIFMKFLIELFGVRKDELRFSLQIFSDINSQEALDYWIRELDVDYSQFWKPTITISGSIGTYRKKSKYGVVTVYYLNSRLRDILVNMLPR